ncbi:P-loop containing nucleoside triphosphate hydrolase protein [Myxozyma melibiosi]|uniref:P-loop containing nucleoside triphosphate hydrolase protein n=1 Tax=Myxozyma melibiosi TaxID=54550 RepID=A0ABR1F2K5_9ASCO
MAIKETIGKASTFVPRTVFPDYRLPQSYFLGHHRKAMLRMQQMIADIDLIFEVRDARAPLATRNALFDKLIATRAKIVVYTKSDICAVNRELLDAMHPEGNYCLVDTNKPRTVKKLLNIAKKEAENRDHFFGLRTMALGMPNVGKSSLLNTLRLVGVNRGKAARTGALAGITRTIPTFVKINEEPDVLLYDTPGVSLPSSMGYRRTLILSALGCTHPKMIDERILADFILFSVNKVDPAVYSKYSPPTNDIEEFLSNYCRYMGLRMKGGYPDFDGGAAHWIDSWRRGKAGKIIYDSLEDFNNQGEDESRFTSLKPTKQQARMMDPYRGK